MTLFKHLWFFTQSKHVNLRNFWGAHLFRKNQTTEINNHFITWNLLDFINMGVSTMFFVKYLSTLRKVEIFLMTLIFGLLWNVMSPNLHVHVLPSVTVFYEPS